MNIVKKAVPVLGVLLLAACNTVAGAGQDMTRAGVAIQQEARAAQ